MKLFKASVFLLSFVSFVGSSEAISFKFRKMSGENSKGSPSQPPLRKAVVKFSVIKYWNDLPFDAEPGAFPMPQYESVCEKTVSLDVYDYSVTQEPGNHMPAFYLGSCEATLDSPDFKTKSNVRVDFGARFFDRLPGTGEKLFSPMASFRYSASGEEVSFATSNEMSGDFKLLKLQLNDSHEFSSFAQEIFVDVAVVDQD